MQFMIFAFGIAASLAGALCFCIAPVGPYIVLGLVVAGTGVGLVILAMRLEPKKTDRWQAPILWGQRKRKEPSE
jgi:hypothetical protein